MSKNYFKRKLYILISFFLLTYISVIIYNPVVLINTIKFALPISFMISIPTYIVLRKIIDKFNYNKQKINKSNNETDDTKDISTFDYEDSYKKEITDNYIETNNIENENKYKQKVKKYR